jgi:hypothetical protein
MFNKDNIVLFEGKDFSNEKIESLLKIITSNTFPWYFQKETTYDKSFRKNTDRFLDNSFLSHLCFKNDVITSDYFNTCMDIFKDFIEKNNLGNIEKLSRVQLNMFYPASENNKLNIAPPHIDMDIPHFVFLCYLNDSDGETIFYNNDFDEVRRVSPKAGKAIIFNGLTYHGISFPKQNQFRAVLNIDFWFKNENN